ncbi:MAG: carboxypeptidase regulatory-like domain-containing protein, partial [Bryobacteraceae bacterium]
MTRIGSLALIAAVLPSTAWPQGGNSTVRGSVRDQAQAAIPVATVTLTNANTNVARATQSNEVGIFVFPGVIPGSYRIVGEFPGMQRFEGKLTVQTAQEMTIDIVLQVAQAATSVEVLDVTPLLQSDSPALSQTLERQRIEQLPVLGRGYQNLLQTVPGLVYSNHGHQTGGRPLAYGLQVGSTQLTMDGNPLTEEHDGWDVARLPDLDAIQELHVEVNNSSAKYARPTTVVMSSRSGTNGFHGALFYNNRNSGYGVARRREDYFQKAPYVNRNEYGLSAGGPLSIPKLYSGRNRTFWFFSWEGTRSKIDSTTQLVVPTEAMKNGDFRGLVDGQGRQYNLFDPFTTNPTTWARQPLAYRGVANTIDPARISPVAKFLFNITKAPTHPQINPLVGPNFIGVSRRPLEQETKSIRIDHRISDKDLIYGRLGLNTHFESLGSNHARWEPIFDDKPIGRYSRWWPNYQVSTTWMHTFSPTTTNEMVATGTRDYKIGGSGYNAGFPVDFAKELGLPNPFGARNWPAISSVGPGDYGAGLESTPFFQVVNYLTFQNNTTKVVRKHELNFGYQYRLDDLPRANFSTAGAFDAGTQATSAYDTASTPSNPLARPFTGFGIANLYLGVLNYGTTFRRPTAFLRRHEHALYVQDNWKVTQRLTLTMGMRHEVRTPLRDRNGLMLSFDYDKRAYVLGSDLNHFIERQAMLPSIVTALQKFGG